MNFLKQHPDLEKEVADDGSVEQRLIDFEKRCADAFFRLEQMVDLRAQQSLELEKRIQAIASGACSASASCLQNVELGRVDGGEVHGSVRAGEERGGRRGRRVHRGEAHGGAPSRGARATF